MKTAIDPRHQARRLALANIYAKNTSNNKLSQFSKTTVQETLGIKGYDRDLYDAIVAGVKEKHDELLISIDKNSSDWDLDKIFKVDMSILLIAVWEISYGKAPKKVIIDESVELAKEFGSFDSKRFINGVLAGIIKEND